MRWLCPIAMILFICLENSASQEVDLTSGRPSQLEPSSSVLNPTWNQVCTGFDSRSGKWSMVGATGPLELNFFCPNGYAFLATKHQSGPRRSGDKIPLVGTCCPLPPGALTEEHEDAVEICPENYVATGASQLVSKEPSPNSNSDSAAWRDTRTQNIRCTKIDSSRFQLGAETTGWNVGWYKHFRNYFDKRTTRARLPEALRFGLGRISRIGWAFSFCAGNPWGSVLVGKTSKYCDGFKFRELQYKGAPNDPPAGTPVHDFASCPAIVDELDPDTTCVKSGTIN